MTFPEESILSMEARLRVRIDEVAARVIDGEAIIINLAAGTCYSLEATGAAMWQLLAAGHTLEETSRRVAESCRADPERVRSDVRELAGRLLAEAIVAVDGHGHAPAGEGAGEGPEAGAAYEPPVLQKHSDMGDILALDLPLPVLKPVQSDES